MKSKTAKQVWNWKDDYALELAGKENSELIALNKAYDNLNSNVASEKMLEQSIMIRLELSRRNEAAGKLLEGVSF